MSSPQLKFTAATRVDDEVKHFAGLNGAPADPRRLAAVDRFLLQFAYACATGAGVSGFIYVCLLIKAAVAQ
ncbi:hypothetical protein [Paraburkholderia sp. D1E]|uniref:hypothetical protein n=1 Tax=Paraburkholderia sp. D1E TaxID=3461398 RepID=UPI0040459672